jgi:signal transduction histidine kinase
MRFFPRLLWIFSCLFFMASSCIANVIIQPGDIAASKNYFLAKDIQVLEDPSITSAEQALQHYLRWQRSTTIASQTKPKSEAAESQTEIWRAYHNEYPSKAYVQTTLWAIIRLHNNTDAPWQNILSNNEPSVHDTTVYLFAGNEDNKTDTLVAQHRFGSAYRLSEQSIASRFFHLPLRIEAQQSLTLVFQIHISGSNHAVMDAMYLQSPEHFYAQDRTDERLTWLYIGAMLLLIVISGIPAFMLRNKAMMMYCMLTLSACLLQFYHDGYARLYFWPESTWLAQHAIAYIVPFFFFSAVQFSRVYLNLSVHAPKLDQLSRYSNYLFAGAAVVATFSPIDIIHLCTFFMILCYLPTQFLLVMQSYLMVSKGIRSARVYAIAWTVITFNAFVQIINTYSNLYTKSHDYGVFNIILILVSLSFFISLTRRIQLQLAERERAEAESKAKSDFLAKMSHEIRTPMNGVLGMTELLQETEQTKQQRHYTQVIYNSGKTLLKVINEILDFSKLEAGKVELSIERFNLLNTIDESMGLLASQAKDKKLKLIYAFPAEIPRYWQGDEPKIRQVILNLLGNAIKFTDHGNVSITVSTGENKAGFFIDVADTGIGLEKEKQIHLFEDFVQADASISRKYGGTGLGLAICKQLIALMDGTIGVESQLGQGATFQFYLPLIESQDQNTPIDYRPVSQQGSSFPGAQSESTVNDSAYHTGQGLHILLAEDNQVNFTVAATMLRRLGHKVEHAENGRVAVAMYQRHNLDNNRSNDNRSDDNSTDKNEKRKRRPFQLILMDCEMPVMDGFSATIEIRQRERNNKIAQPLPIIALTAHATHEHLQRCLSCGMNAYLSKPINTEQLRTSINKAFKTRP